MSVDLSEIDKSIEQWNKHTFQEYKDWLFKQITSNQETSIFLKCHIQKFSNQYKRQIGREENYLL